MFVEKKVRYSALFTNLIRWHASAVSFPLSDIILVQLACPLSDVMFYLHSGITNPSLHKHWLKQNYFLNISFSGILKSQCLFIGALCKSMIVW